MERPRERSERRREGRTRASHGVVGARLPHRRMCACVRAWIRGVRAWPVDRLLGTRDVRARNCVPVLKLFISPTATDPRRTIAPHMGPTQPGPSGMIMHRSASHYTYTYPVYPVPILPTRYVDYTTSRAPRPPSPLFDHVHPFFPPIRPVTAFAPPSCCIHTHTTRASYTYLSPVDRYAQCTMLRVKAWARTRIYLAYERVARTLRIIASCEKTEENWISR